MEQMTNARLDLPATALITRGVRRWLAALNMASVTEFTLKTGRRADVMAVDAAGCLTIVEVKSSIADFRADRKWHEYAPFCDRFFFAVGESFPVDILPDDCGILVADAYGAIVLRDAPAMKMAGVRRKALTLRLAMVAGARLHLAEDPGLPLAG